MVRCPLNYKKERSTTTNIQVSFSLDCAWKGSKQELLLASLQWGKMTLVVTICVIIRGKARSQQMCPEEQLSRPVDGSPHNMSHSLTEVQVHNAQVILNDNTSLKRALLIKSQNASSRHRYTLPH